MIMVKDQYIALICTHCDFFKEDEDEQLECAFKVLKSMLKKGIISQQEIEDVKYPVLAHGVVLRRLEAPYVYKIDEDELYELDEEAFEFLRRCDGTHLLSELDVSDYDVVEYMVNEGIIIMQSSPQPRKIRIGESETPSLRYLLLNITDRCNLVCKHCYLGDTKEKEMKQEIFEKAVSEFENMGGMKLMISGGEPLLHSKFWKLMESLLSYELRVVILSNATLIGREEARKLSEYVDEVQLSIDGIKAHDLLRGKGSYEKAIKAISYLQSYDVSVSIATMVHTYKEEFEEMHKLFSDMKVISWSVDHVWLEILRSIRILLLIYKRQQA